MKRICFLLLVFSIISDSLSAYPRKVLLEFGTSCDCYVCPNAHSVIENQILPLYPQTVVMAIHGNKLIPYPDDPFVNFNGSEIRNLLDPSFPLPGIWIDRSTFYYQSYQSAKDSVIYRYSNNGTTPVRIQVISKNYTPSTRQLALSVSVNSEQTIQGRYYLVFSIIENNIIYRQEGASQNYVHKWVVRDIVSGAAGDLLVNGTWQSGTTYTKNLSAALDTGWVPNNCMYTLYVYKSCYPDSMLNHAEVFQAETGTVTGSIGINGNTQTAVKYYLGQNYPNPFNPVTRIKFAVQKRGPVSLKVYDIAGKQVEVLCSGTLNAGEYNAEFDGSRLAGGVYFYVLNTGNISESRKMIMIK